jgi:ketosteroid isomerase-like protein
MSVTAAPSVGTEVVTAFFAAYAAQDVERMVELCTDNADFNYMPVEAWARQRVVRGNGKVRTIGKVFWTTLIDSFPDLTNKVTYITADEDGQMAAEVVISGTQVKAFGTIGSQGMHMDLPHLFILRVNEEGLIEAITGYWDSADMFRQLGRLEVD